MKSVCYECFSTRLYFYMTFNYCFRMRRFKYLLALFCLSLVVAPFVSCDDDDEETDKDLNNDDARIRSVRFFSLDSDMKVVINDVEGIIFNYDSLSYGTKIDSVLVYFYGYTSSPSIKFLDNGEWKDFSNGDKLPLAKPLSILSTSVDGTQQKNYTIDVRVHCYDVDAFSWEKLATIEDYKTIVAQKAIITDNGYLWYCSNDEGKSFQYKSSDGNDWSMTELTIEGLNWNSLVYDGSLFYVMDEQFSIFSSNDGVEFEPYASNLSEVQFLFVNNNTLWVVADNAFWVKTDDVEPLERVQDLPAGFPTENLLAFAAKSGRTELAYIYSTSDRGTIIWAVDENGNAFKVLHEGKIPVLKSPMPFAYDNTLGIIGGELADGEFSTKCYVSYNSGGTWNEDKHKNLGINVGGIAQAGLFVTSRNGEMIIIGGKMANGYSTSVWHGVLNKLKEDELIYGK